MVIPKKIMIEAVQQAKVLPYEEELVSNLREINYQGLPLSICVLTKDICQGECYVTSINLTRGMNQFQLVHGDVNCIELNDSYPNHSWVEKDGFVYDPTDGFKWDKNLYYTLFSPIVREVYDENTVANYHYYSEVVSKGHIEIPLEQTALMIQYIEMLNDEEKSVNSERLQGEIDFWRKQNGINYRYSEETMKKYKEYMKRN